MPVGLSSVLDRLIAIQMARGAPASHSLRRLLQIPTGSRVFVLLSGGIDSTVLMFLALHRALDVCAVEFMRAQRPARERACVEALVAAADVDCYRIAYPDVTVLSRHEGVHGGMVVESNALYYALAGNVAAACGIEFVLGGTILADWQTHDASNARPHYFDLLNEMLGSEHGFSAPRVLVPLLFSSKEEVVRLGIGLGVPFVQTWSCTSESTTPCGQCSQCIERATAMSLNGLIEPNGKSR